MGYNIGDVSGNSTGGPGNWTFTADLTTPGLTTVSGDFDVADLFSGGSLGEATDGYVFSALSTNAYGSLSSDTTTGQFVFTIDRAAVMASGSDQVVSFTITGTSGEDVDDDMVFMNLLICVLRGTRVHTKNGMAMVEDLKPGDLVVTKDNGARPVRWIGSRRLDAADLDAEPALRPVRISAGALGPQQPSRMLGVSPQHRILVSDWRAELMFGETEVLVPAKALVNDTTVRVDQTRKPVEYFHLLFDSHEIIYTEGCPTESFHPTGYSLNELGDASRVELHRLFPQLFEAEGCGDTVRPALRPWEGAMLSRTGTEQQGTGA